MIKTLESMIEKVPARLVISMGIAGGLMGVIVSIVEGPLGMESSTVSLTVFSIAIILLAPLCLFLSCILLWLIFSTGEGR